MSSSAIPSIKRHFPKQEFSQGSQIKLGSFRPLLIDISTKFGVTLRLHQKNFLTVPERQLNSFFSNHDLKDTYQILINFFEALCDTTRPDKRLLRTSFELEDLLRTNAKAKDIIATKRLMLLADDLRFKKGSITFLDGHLPSWQGGVVDLTITLKLENIDIDFAFGAVELLRDGDIDVKKNGNIIKLEDCIAQAEAFLS